MVGKLVECISPYATFALVQGQRSKKSMESMFIDVLYCILFLAEE